MTISVIVVITLVGLDFVFKSYYAYMTDEAKAEKTAPKTDLLAQVALEKAAFAAAKVPVDQAMGQVAKGTRPELIAPQPSEDMAPMTGWSKMPKLPPIAAPSSDVRGAAAPDAGADITDAGAAMTDARAPAPGRDAAAPAPPHSGAHAPAHP
ncbi:MAG TPA: hypothetical protein VLT33_37920 [Labilithrix sp.]|nr:hypothetical protein [Labilithrix sp.]